MSDAVQALLSEIEKELKQQQLWSEIPPAKAAISSSLPFCYDTLSAEQWLQFVLLPRLQALLDTGQDLPARVSILPYAEEAFKTEQGRLRPLLMLIAQLDSSLTGEA